MARPKQLNLSAHHRTRSWSLSRRLIVSLTLSLGALWLMAATLAGWATVHETNEVFDSALQETAQRLLPLALDDIEEQSEERDREIEGMLPVPGHKEYLIYQFRDRDGRVILRSHDAPVAAFPAPLNHGFAEIDGRRFYTESTPDGRFLIQVAEKPAHRQGALFRGVVALVAPLLLLLPIAVFVIWRAVARSVRPLRAVREEISARGGSNLEPVSEAELPSELTPIVRDVNRLIERLGAALEAERTFTANSAHEMRTPVAAALAQVQRLGAELATTTHHARIRQIEDALRRLGARVTKLLQLARADSRIAVTDQSSDLLPIIRIVVDELSRMSGDPSCIVFDAGAHIKLAAQVDIDAFAIVLRNLLENALLHGDRTQPVRIWIACDRDIHIANSGPVIAPDVLRRLTHRFVRGQTSVEGSGLGLTIAERILNQAGGRLELYSPASHQTDGFEAVIRLAK